MGMVQRSGLERGSTGAPRPSGPPYQNLQPSKGAVSCKPSSGIMQESFQHPKALRRFGHLYGCLLCSFCLPILSKRTLLLTQVRRMRCGSSCSASQCRKTRIQDSGTRICRLAAWTDLGIAPPPWALLSQPNRSINLLTRGSQGSALKINTFPGILFIPCPGILNAKSRAVMIVRVSPAPN
jgi:hypothetical protein